MSIKIYPHKLSGEVNVIGSKSYAHRALIAASLAIGVSVIKNYPQSDDLLATREALKHVGISLIGDNVYGKKWVYDKKPIDCLASGSTLRFFIPLSVQMGSEITFTGVKRLFERPLDVYESIFDLSRVVGDHTFLKVLGALNKARYVVDGSKSSQFLSGLLFALPREKHDSVIELSTPLQSESYVDMTIEMLKKASVEITKLDNKYYIKGSQTYRPFDYEVEGDYSQAAFFMVAATIGNAIQLKNVSEVSNQGDFAIISILKDMGADITYDVENKSYVINPKKTYATTIDLKDIPDLGPILMVLASLSEGVTHFKHVNRLRYKESDRLDAMLDILGKCGVSYTLHSDALEIKGQHVLKGGQSFSTKGDHRIAMSLAVLSIRADNPIIIDDERVVSKSYPEFFTIFKSLGGHYESY